MIEEFGISFNMEINLMWPRRMVLYIAFLGGLCKRASK